MKKPYSFHSALIIFLTFIFTDVIAFSQSSGLPLLDINKIKFDFGKTRYMEKKCEEVVFKNIGDTLLALYQIDSLLKPFYGNITYPHELNEGDSLVFDICYQPVRANRDSQRVFLRADTRLSNSIAMLFDISRSMNFFFPNESVTKLQAAVEAGKRFINSMLATPKVWDEAAIFSFSQEFYVNQNFTTNKAALLNSLPTNAISGTYFFMACVESINRLKQRPYQKVMIALTDGQDSKKTLYTPKEVIDSAIANNIRIFTVGIGNDVADDTLSNIASKTGGKYFKATTGKQLLDVYYEIFNLLSKNIELYFDVLGICEGAELDMECNGARFVSPRDTVTFPIWVHSISTKDAMNAEYELSVSFNKNLLYPVALQVETTESTFAYKNDGLLKISGLNTANLDSLPLTELKFIALLGDSNCTDVRLDSLVFDISPQKAVIEGIISCRVCINTCVRQLRQVQSILPTALYPCVPNPFSDKTEIRFYIASINKYELNIYNSMGVLVMNLINDVLKPGDYSLTLKGNSFESGIYTYSLEGGGYIFSRQMVVIK